MKKLTVHRALRKITMPHKIMKPTITIEEQTIEVNEPILEDAIESPKEEEEVVITSKKQSGKNKKNNTNDKASEEENKESNKKKNNEYKGKN